MSLAISKEGDVVVLNSAGDLIKVNSSNGEVYWSLNASGSVYAYATDFFVSSKIVVVDNEIIFSAGSNFFSYDLTTGYMNWEQIQKISKFPQTCPTIPTCSAAFVCV